MPEVIIPTDESFDRALRRYPKKCERAGLLADPTRHHHYDKPGGRRRRKVDAVARPRQRSVRSPR